MRLSRFPVLLVISATLFAGYSSAQSVPPVLPGAADPGRLPEQMRSVPEVTPDAVIEIPEIGPTAVVSSEGQKSFVLNSVGIDGAKTFSAGELKPLYQKYVGREVTIADLQRIGNAISQFYHEKGYFLTRAIVPQQTVSGGAVRILVVEGYVSQVRFEYENGMAPSRDLFGILAATKKTILEMRPLNGAALERQLLLLSDLHGVKGTTVLETLKDGEAAPGAVGMVIKLSRKAPSVSVKADNNGSRYTGPYAITASAQVSPGLFAFDNLSATGFVALPDTNVKFGALSYSVPVSASGTSVSISGQYSNSQPKFTLRPYDIDGTFYKMSLAVSQPIIRSRSTNLFLSAALDYSDSYTGALKARLYHDSLRVIRLSADLNHADRWGGLNMASLTFSQGLDILGARKTGSVDLSRAKGHSDFTKFELIVSRLQNLGDDWDMYFAGSGQIAGQSLLVSETFGFGGQSFGRAYDPSELTGDNGVSGTFELRYNAVPRVAGITIQPFAFYDIGEVWNVTGGGALYGHSAGGGVRLAHESGLNATVGIAAPLKQTGMGTASNPRLLLQIGYSF